jgi:flavin reductase (DIM6/NTAB) family NADH-FMN oxidoreductase RutF
VPRASTTWKSLDPGDLAPKDAYALLVSAVVPRPIALVSTISENGVANLSPFSFFTAISSTPPVVAISIGRGREGEKDTMRNIRATRAFVVNVVDRALAAAAVASAAAHPPDVNEFLVTGLTELPSDKVPAPRVAESPIHLECVVSDLVESPGGADATLVLGRVLRFHVMRRILVDGAIDPSMLDPVARLGADLYAPLGDIFEL